MRTIDAIARHSRILAVLAFLVLPLPVQGQVVEVRAAEEARMRALQEELRAAQERLQERQHEIQERLLRESARVRELKERELQEVRERMQEVLVRARAGVRLGVSLDPRQGRDHDREGVLVKDVMDDSPADEAGLERGDVITHLDGRSLLDPLPDDEEEELDEYGSLPVQRLMAMTRELEEGDVVEVRYLRDGSPDAVSVEVAEMDSPGFWVTSRDGKDLRTHFDFDPDIGRVWTHRLPRAGAFRFHAPGLEEGPHSVRLYMGRTRHDLELTEVNEGLAEYFSTDRGVLVLEVDEDSELELRPGDVILQIGDRTVEDEEDVLRILSSYEDGESVAFTVMRQGRQATVEGVVR